MQNYKKMGRNKGQMKSNKVEIACNRKKNNNNKTSIVANCIENLLYAAHN